MNFISKNKIFQRAREIENPINFPSQSSEEDLIVRNFDRNKKKTKFILFLFFVVFSVLAMRAFYLQVVKGEHYKNLSENNRIRAITIKAPRGIIKDRNGMILAKNVPGFDLVFIPADLPTDKKERDSLARDLADFIGLNKSLIFSNFEGVENNSNKAFLLKENIPHQLAISFVEKSEKFRGIYLEKTAKREYVDGEIFSPIVGYIGKISPNELKADEKYLMTDYIGKEGLEYSYEKWLKGEHGKRLVEVDSFGNIKKELGIVSPKQGDELALSIDGELQKKAFETLKKIVGENESAESASLVAIDPRDGGVLALVNFPSYDNNLFSEGISSEIFSNLLEDEKKPMLNRAIKGEYNPGSVFKPVVAVGALEEGIISEDTMVGCSGGISIGQWNFPDWKTHGPTDVKKAIAQSCNVFFYSIGGGWENIKGLGIDKMKKYANLFGIGKLTGIDLPGETSGNVPDSDWKFKKFGEKWYVGDDYHASIGQGFVTVTPIQMALSTATIANGGKLFRPQLVSLIMKNNQEKEDLGKNIEDEKVVSTESVAVVRAGMRETVLGEGGSGRSLANIGVVTGGKTGTAQFGNQDKTHSWYISFGPYENPEIAMAVLIAGGGQGHELAVPATKEIYEWYFGGRN